MSAEPIDDGGPAYPRGSTLADDGQVWTTSQTGQSYRADVAKECLAALIAGNPRYRYEATKNDVAVHAVELADALIAALKGGPR